MLAHERAHVDPREIGPLGAHAGQLVQNRVEDRDGLVGLPDLVGVGVDEHRPVLGVNVVNGPPLAIDVAGGTFDVAQQRFDARPQIGRGH